MYWVLVKTITTISEMQTESGRLRLSGKRIGFVPTMGALHEGHLSLVREARKHADIVVMSVFVNPAQFGPTEDFKRYPRDIARDASLAEEVGVDILFVPTVEAIYPKGFRTYTEVHQLSAVWEGKIRPEHFRGVVTVVLKLFNIVQPHVAVFGQKDIQQAVVIQRMVDDMAFDIRMIVAPIIREADGLAMSSRNVYLTPEERSQAPVLRKSLDVAEQMIRNGARDTALIRTKIEEIIALAPQAKIDYIAIVEGDALEERQHLEAGGNYIIALAVRFGGTRLIDNTRIHVS
jgi:pantoate--beta-alanine ligase